MDNEQNTSTVDVGTQTEEKQSTKTFTQSDNDKLVAEAIRREREKYQDYDQVKKELETLRKSQKERELSEMSELEKHKAMLEEIQSEKSKIDQELSFYRQKEAIGNVLSNEKYSKLPPIYRQAVKYSESVEEIMKSADEMLSQFEKDTGTIVKSTFGISDPVVDPIIKTANGVIKSAGDMQSAVRAKILEKIKTHNNS